MTHFKENDLKRLLAQPVQYSTAKANYYLRWGNTIRNFTPEGTDYYLHQEKILINEQIVNGTLDLTILPEYLGSNASNTILIGDFVDQYRNGDKRIRSNRNWLFRPREPKGFNNTPLEFLIQIKDLPTLMTLNGWRPKALHEPDGTKCLRLQSSNVGGSSHTSWVLFSWDGNGFEITFPVYYKLETGERCFMKQMLVWVFHLNHPENTPENVDYVNLVISQLEMIRNGCNQESTNRFIKNWHGNKR